MYSALTFDVMKSYLTRVLDKKFVLATDVLARMFWPRRLGHGRFGQIKVQNMTFWPNAISTQKETLYGLFMLLYKQCK